MGSCSCYCKWKKNSNIVTFSLLLLAAWLLNVAAWITVTGPMVRGAGTYEVILHLFFPEGQLHPGAAVEVAPLGQPIQIGSSQAHNLEQKSLQGPASGNGGVTTQQPKASGTRAPVRQTTTTTTTSRQPEAPHVLLLPGEAGGPAVEDARGATAGEAEPWEFISFLPERTLKAKLDSCALIGSSSILNEKGTGPTIDRHDTVIRVNRVPVKGESKDFGARTDIFVGNCRSWQDPTVVTSVKGVRFRCKKACPKVQLLKWGCQKAFINPKTMNSSLVTGTLKRSTYAVIKYLHLFQNRHGQAVPTMGLHAFLTFAPLCNHLTLYGFGGATTSAGGDSGITKIHDVEKDNELLDGILAPNFTIPPAAVDGHQHGHRWLKRWLPKIRSSVTIVREGVTAASKTLEWPAEVRERKPAAVGRVTSTKAVKHRVIVRRVEVRTKPVNGKMMGTLVKGQIVPLRESDSTGDWRKVVSTTFTGWVQVRRGGEPTVELA
mmetsp:Transcript_9396/g.17020  ORF Transcript_9396/g.17020 Transcript_9396/m.17020 type:complete len:490 (-) Transcript_9396:66-1535(-)